MLFDVIETVMTDGLPINNASVIKLVEEGIPCLFKMGNEQGCIVTDRGYELYTDIKTAEYHSLGM